MNDKFFIVVLTTTILVVSWAFFATNGSYQNALKSRFYYEIGNYEKANEFAKAAYEKDIYNKMAYTVMVQSEISLRYSKYIQQGNEYLEKIMQISKEESVSKVEQNRIRLICEIMIGEYDRLKSSILINNSLQEEAKSMRDKFLKLHVELF